MDALRFFKERERMCFAHPVVCKGCPLSEKFSGICLVWCANHTEEAIAVVEKWAREHPRKTRQSEFLKQWPNASVSEGVLNIDPCSVDTEFEHSLCGEDKCAQCRREFWMQEVE